MSARLTIDPWDPAYGVSVEVEDLDAAAGEVELGVELAPERWAPIRPPQQAVLPSRLLFVDGVRRVEAHVWIEAPGALAGEEADAGICASFAAGAMCCDGVARLVDVEVGRALVSSSGHAEHLPTAAGTFTATVSNGALPAQLSLALQQAMGAAEVRVADRARDAAGCDLLVVDGPLRGRALASRAVGFVKTHHVAYLPPEQHRLVGRLAAGERTPLFVLGTGWTRYSWYLRLPGGRGAPWAGVVRCECPPELSAAAARELADATSTILPSFASEAIKDARAPQNLYPIGALERELRHRLGDPLVVYRALRVAVARRAA